MCVGLTLLDQAIKNPDIKEVAEDNKLVHIYYTGLWEKNYARIGLDKGCVFRKSSSHSKLHNLLITLLDTYNSNDISILMLRMKLRMV